MKRIKLGTALLLIVIAALVARERRTGVRENRLSAELRKLQERAEVENIIALQVEAHARPHFRLQVEQMRRETKLLQKITGQPGARGEGKR